MTNKFFICALLLLSMNSMAANNSSSTTTTKDQDFPVLVQDHADITFGDISTTAGRITNVRFGRMAYYAVSFELKGDEASVAQLVALKVASFTYKGEAYPLLFQKQNEKVIVFCFVHDKQVRYPQELKPVISDVLKKMLRKSTLELTTRHRWIRVPAQTKQAKDALLGLTKLSIKNIDLPIISFMPEPEELITVDVMGTSQQNFRVGIPKEIASDDDRCEKFFIEMLGLNDTEDFWYEIVKEPIPTPVAQSKAAPGFKEPTLEEMQKALAKERNEMACMYGFPPHNVKNTPVSTTTTTQTMTTTQTTTTTQANTTTKNLEKEAATKSQIVVKLWGLGIKVELACPPLEQPICVFKDNLLRHLNMPVDEAIELMSNGNNDLLLQPKLSIAEVQNKLLKLDDSFYAPLWLRFQQYTAYNEPMIKIPVFIDEEHKITINVPQSCTGAEFIESLLTTLDWHKKTPVELHSLVGIDLLTPDHLKLTMKMLKLKLALRGENLQEGVNLVRKDGDE